MRTYIEFVASRLFGTGVDTLVLWLCSTFLFTSYWGAYVVSPIISFEFAVMSNFLWSYCWIWRKRIHNKNSGDFWIRFLIFNASSIVGFLIKMLFLLIFEKIFGWDVVYCNLVALLISGLFNYFLADCLVFRKQSVISQR
ncbi:GtrA family protein [uncultured Bacteroides sp.]|uniref:GtrA family protein n=1 Tax=uncultured Bacteroides sp. TaxID=162156 RepID=UPI00260E4EC1|nr:GtrA family protein [uncultured Bacteroides sp.]